MRNNFKGKKILITGGLGFIGSHLAAELVEKNATVTIIDNLDPNQGGNLFNIRDIKNKITIYKDDIRNIDLVKKIIEDKDYIFHLARQTDHILSQKNPYPDIDVNIRGTAIILEAIKNYNKSGKLIYIGTRGQYGSQVKIPVSETAVSSPRGIYELTNLTAEMMIKIYVDVHKVDAVMLRLTNTYGPKSQMKHDHYGIVNWFIRLALDGKEIPIFGDGKLVRDFLYIDDAVAAILKTAIHSKCNGEIINIGNSKGYTFLELVDMIIKLNGYGSYKFTNFTPERKSQEPGNFTTDITKITCLTGWKPKTNLEEGIKKTLDFYKKYNKFYW